MGTRDALRLGHVRPPAAHRLFFVTPPGSGVQQSENDDDDACAGRYLDASRGPRSPIRRRPQQARRPIREFKSPTSIPQACLGAQGGLGRALANHATGRSDTQLNRLTAVGVIGPTNCTDAAGRERLDAEGLRNARIHPMASASARHMHKGGSAEVWSGRRVIRSRAHSTAHLWRRSCGCANRAACRCSAGRLAA